MRVDAVLRGLALSLVAASLCWPVLAAPRMSGSSLPTGSSGDFLRHDGTAWDNSTIGVTDLPLAAVKTTGSYSDPAWITDLAKSKVALGNVENTALSTWAGSANITTVGALAMGSIATGFGNIQTAGTLQTGAATVSSLVSSGAVSGTTGTFTGNTTTGGATVLGNQTNNGTTAALSTAATGIVTYNRTTQTDAIAASTTADVLRFQDQAGTVIGNAAIVGRIFLWAWRSDSAANANSMIYDITTTGNGVTNATLTLIKDQQRGTFPISSCGLAADGGSGAVKVQCTTGMTEPNTTQVNVSFMGLVK